MVLALVPVPVCAGVPGSLSAPRLPSVEQLGQAPVLSARVYLHDLIAKAFKSPSTPEPPCWRPGRQPRRRDTTASSGPGRRPGRVPQAARAGRIAVLRAERARHQSGIEIRRPTWKNLVFTGSPGTGKSRVAAAVARLYRELGLLSYGNVIELFAADLAGETSCETGTLVEEAVTRAGGDLLMISDAHAWHRLPDRGQHVLRCLYRELTRSRDHHKGELAVILAGRAGPLSDLLHASPALTAPFPAVICPPYDAGQITAIFAALVGEAGLTLNPDTVARTTAVLAQAERDHGSGSARLAVRLLDEATSRQARRIAAIPGPRNPAILSTVTVADIPAHLSPGDEPAHDWPGQYL